MKEPINLEEYLLNPLHAEQKTALKGTNTIIAEFAKTQIATTSPLNAESEGGGEF